MSHGGRTDTTIKETPVDGIDMFRLGRLPVVPFSTNVKGHNTVSSLFPFLSNVHEGYINF